MVNLNGSAPDSDVVNGVGKTNGATPESYLVVGSLSNTTDGSYQDTLSNLSGQEVNAQMWDRIVEADMLKTSPAKFTKVIVLATTDQMGESSMKKLLSKISEAMASSGDLEIRSEIDISLDGVLSSSSFVDISRTDGKLTARKAESNLPQAPLHLKRSKPSSGKKAALWSLNSLPAQSPVIDESSLLTEEDNMSRSAIQRPDCDVKRTRKACKGCTCGLRDVSLDNAADSDAPAAVGSGFSSSCGNCYLGDAFRCAGCPMTGLPAFEPGQKVEIGNFISDDI